MVRLISKLLFLSLILAFFTKISFSQNALHCLEFIDENTGITVGENGTIFRTTDAGASWIEVPTNVTNTLNKTSVIDGGGGVVIVGNNGTILKSDDNGISFVTVSAMNNRFSSADYYGVCINSNGIGFIVGAAGAMLKTTDYGSTWIAVQSNGTLDLNAVSFSGLDNGIVVGKNNSILFTSDGGATWQAPGTVLSFVNDIKFVRMVDRATAYATTAEGRILKTSDGGNSWSVIYSDSGERSLYRVNRTGAGSLVAAGNNGDIIISYDEGQTWAVQNTGISNNIFCLAFSNDMTGFAGGENGIMIRTDDGGQNWLAVNYIPTVNRKAILKKELTAGNYPNPFNPSTLISYYLPFDANVNIRIFDITGKLVSELVNSFQKTGNYNSVFNASGLSSGVYFYRITAVNNTSRIDRTMRMILTK